MEDKRKFTFAKSDDDNIPSDAKNSDYWDERSATYDVFGNAIRNRPDDDVEGEEDEYVPNESFD